jgi:hypothetical protein
LRQRPVQARREFSIERDLTQIETQADARRAAGRVI